MSNVLDDNISCLHQGLTLLKQLTGSQYVQPNTSVRSGSIGEHIRHNIDHYACFLEGLESGQVDYDDRDRESRIETDPEYALSLMKSICEKISQINPKTLDAPIKIKMASGVDNNECISNSSVRRELQFLVSHTIHHYAIVGLLCRMDGVQLEDNFGVAPSTIRHRQQLQGA